MADFARGRPIFLTCFYMDKSIKFINAESKDTGKTCVICGGVIFGKDHFNLCLCAYPKLYSIKTIKK